MQVRKGARACLIGLNAGATEKTATLSPLVDKQFGVILGSHNAWSFSNNGRGFLQAAHPHA